MQWDRNTAGRLERVTAAQEQGFEIDPHSAQMDPPQEEQQSQQGPREPNAYRSLRDHIHPPRVSAPSCIIPPAEEVAVKPYFMRHFQRRCSGYGAPQVESLSTDPKRQGKNLAKCIKAKNHKELGRAAGRIPKKIL